MSDRWDRPSPYILYGPFPVKRLRALCGTLALLVGWIFFSMGLEHADLVCARHERNEAQCSLTHGFPGFVRHMDIPIARVRAIRVEDETTSSKGTVTHWGVPYIELRDAPPIRLMRTMPDEAARFAATINAGLANEDRSFGASVRGPWWALLASLVAVILGIALVRSAFRGLGCFHFEVDDAGIVRVRRYILGLCASTHVVSLENVVEVSISWAYAKDHLAAAKDSPIERTGRIVLIDAEGDERPLTERTFRGTRVHYRAAAALRARLRLAPAHGPIEAGLDAASKPVPHPWGQTVSGKIGAMWLGLCFGSIVGMAVVWSAAVAIGLDDGRDSAGCWGPTGALLGVALGITIALRAIRPRAPD